MKKLLLLSSIIACICSCTSKKQIHYMKGADKYPGSDITFNEYTLQPQDILKIDVYSSNLNAAMPYNKLGAFNERIANATLQSLQLDGYVISDDYTFEFPVFGNISAKNKTTRGLEKEIKKMLIDGEHLLDPIVNIRLLNAKFTVLGELQKPGTYSFVEDRLSILQALGYAGDLTIDGVRDEVYLIREMNKQRTIYTIDLTDIKTLNESNFYIQPNDVIVVNPNYRKVKSAGFIGNPSSIASISSLILSITLLLINN